jgi:gamma-glutamyltranspeptidase/glutathione hydrolase
VVVALAVALSIQGALAGPPARAERQMVAAANPLAAQAGLDILRAGGSAADAAIAAQLVLNLVEPQSSGIGGGAFLLHYGGETRDLAAYDGRETAPAAATPELFLTPEGAPMKFWDAVVGGRSVGVPGLLRMLELAHGDHGRLPWARLFEPAIQLAERGFAVSPRLAGLIANDKHLKTFPETAAYFFGADGAPHPVGHVLKNPAFARTLRRVAAGGAAAFYNGPIAREIVAAVNGAAGNPGAMTLDDLSGYTAKRRAVLCRPYRAWRVCGMPPPTSGGIAVLQILGILQSFDLAALEPNSAEALHLIAEASRLAFADRNRFLADSDFVPVPVTQLLDRAYLARRAKLISPATTLGKAEPGLPTQKGAMPAQADPPSTSHLAVVDSTGNAVSMTSSIESAFGSRLMAGGFMLNNELTDFAFRPEAEGRAIANQVEAGKRPRSSMSPSLVLDKDGRLVLALGSPGGSRIIGYVAKALIAHLDWGLDVQAAIALPHAVNRNGATDLEADTPVATLKPALEALGHEAKVRKLTSGLHGIAVTPNGLEGGADPRREGIAVGD